MRTTTFTLILMLLLSACASDSADPATSEGAAGVRVVDATAAAAIIEDDPARTVIDIRTPEEFAEGHLEGAQLIDFYEADFADRIAELDRDDPYVIYCRSGNRSQQARQLFDDLGFTDVVDVDGGIVSWVDAGLPTVQ